jgi:hypothetical protein
MYNRLKTLVNQVRNLGSTKWDDHEMVKVIIRSLVFLNPMQVQLIRGNPRYTLMSPEEVIGNCRCFDPGGSLDRRVNCRCVSQPRWVGARWDTKGENSKGKPRPSCCPTPRVDGCACSRGLQAFAWERERARALCVGPFSGAANPLYESPGPSFYRRKERAQVYNGGVAMC